eukprot:XP_001708851.1 Hypothetical protein GL50803_34716 [Giardia lamblia ATCC 50803]
MLLGTFSREHLKCVFTLPAVDMTLCPGVLNLRYTVYHMHGLLPKVTIIFNGSVPSSLKVIRGVGGHVLVVQ